MKPELDILIPTYERPQALAMTLTSLAAQTRRDFRLVISSQDDEPVFDRPEVRAALNVLSAHGHPLEEHIHLPRRGMAEQRQFLLSRVTAPYALYLDDDVILEPYVIANLLDTMREEQCGFVGAALTGLSYLDDVRPEEQRIEFWDGPVRPERVIPDSPEWQRYRLHNAANLYHVQQRLGLSPADPLKYKVAWVGGCVLYDAAKLRAVGGFSFWKDLPANHCGEDVLAQLRVMARFGGSGIIPAGVYHQEYETTLPDRSNNAPYILPLDFEAPGREVRAGRSGPSGRNGGVFTHQEEEPELRIPAGREGLVPNVHKIAVLRSNAIGDLVFVLPALEALRQAYPQAEIVYLGQEWHVAFLGSRPGPVDRVEVVPPTFGVSHQDGGPGDPAAQARFFERMAAERFDLALQLHGGGLYSNPFIHKLGARLTAGLRTPDAAPLDRWIPYDYFQPEILRYLETVSLVGARPVSFEPRLVVTSADREAADRVVPPDERPLVVLHPGAGDPRRRWPADKFAAVGDALAAAGARIVITGARDEQELVQTIRSTMQYEAQDTCYQLSLCGLLGLLDRANLVVSNDTGPLHLAQAVATPTVGLFWVGNLITAGPPAHARHRPLISWRLECPVCGRNTIDDRCEHRVSFVADIPLESVLDAAFQLMEMEPAAGEPAGF